MNNRWQQGNTTKYVKIDTDNTIDLGIDLYDELASSDSLANVVFTSTSSGITFSDPTAYTDQPTGHSVPHIAQAFFTPTATGIHPIKLTATTSNSKTIVYHFDILTEE